MARQGILVAIWLYVLASIGVPRLRLRHKGSSAIVVIPMTPESLHTVISAAMIVIGAAVVIAGRWLDRRTPRV